MTTLERESWGNIVEKMVQIIRLRWFRYVERRSVDSIVRIVVQMDHSRIS